MFLRLRPAGAEDVAADYAVQGKGDGGDDEGGDEGRPEAVDDEVHVEPVADFLGEEEDEGVDDEDEEAQCDELQGAGEKHEDGPEDGADGEEDEAGGDEGLPAIDYDAVGRVPEPVHDRLSSQEAEGDDAPADEDAHDPGDVAALPRGFGAVPVVVEGETPHWWGVYRKKEDGRWKMTLPLGYEARAARPEDLDAVVALIAACEIADEGNAEVSRDDVRGAWERARFNLGEDAWVVEAPDGTLVGYGDVWPREDYGHIEGDGYVHPEHRGRGIGRWLVRAMERRASEIAVHAQPGTRVLLRSTVIAADKDACELFESEGFTPGRHFWRMVIDLDNPVPEPQWPEGGLGADLRARGCGRGARSGAAGVLGQPPARADRVRGLAGRDDGAGVVRPVTLVPGRA